MKNLYVIFITAMVLFSCQSEDNTVTQNLDSALTKSAPLSLLMSRVSQNPTHCDNVLDNSNCYSIQLPVTLTVNGQQINVTTESDFDEVEDNLNASNWDDDIIHFSFPIVILFRNFEQLTINSQTELDAVDCSGDDDFNEIRCLDFVFPVSINVYDTNNQIANMVTINSNIELYNFIDDVTEAQIFSIVYPITMTLSNGPSITVDNNNDLENVIEDAIDDCDNDTPGPGPEPTELQDIIIDGTWHISFCEGGPGNFQWYNFTFLDNGTIVVVKNNVTSYGTWNLYMDGSHQKMELAFTDQQLHNLEDDWKVTEYNESNFRLKHDNSGSGGGGGSGSNSPGSSGGNDYVYFTKN